MAAVIAIALTILVALLVRRTDVGLFHRGLGGVNRAAASLAGMFLARGGASVITQDSVPIIYEFHSWISSLIIRLPSGVRLNLIGLAMVAIFIVGALVERRTKFGSHVYALGGNPVSKSLMAATGRSHHNWCLYAVKRTGCIGRNRLLPIYISWLSTRCGWS